MRQWFEQLEARRLMAADVTATLVNGTLRIRGDEGDNAVYVYGEPGTAGAFRVQVRTTDGPEGPGIQEVLIRDATDVTVELGGGNDYVSFHDVLLAGGLRHDGGAGDDTFLVEGASIGGDLRVSDPSGQTTVALAEMAVAGPANVAAAGPGRAVLEFDRSTFNRGLSIAAGGGDDALTVMASEFGRALAIAAGGGANRVDLAGATVRGRTRLTGGTGSDEVTVVDSSFTGRFLTRTAQGDDSVALVDSTFRRKTINTGRGNDTRTGGVSAGWDFAAGEQGWATGFADYPDGYVTFGPNGEPLQEAEDAWEMQAGLRPLPAELGTSGTGMMLSGDNRSDDLFMFLKRRLGPEEGVVPGQAYRVIFDITFASNGTDCTGQSVYLKAGAGPDEPVPVLDPRGLYFRMNVDKDSQSNSGPAASRVGTIDNGIPCEEAQLRRYPYVSLRRRHVHTAVVTAGADGSIWLLVGTDSGFEWTTMLYYQSVRVALVPVAESAA